MAAIGVTKTKLKDQRFIVYGAGSAGLGITRQLRDGMVTADEVSAQEANSKFYLIDKHGLIKPSIGAANIREDLKDFVRPDDEWEDVPKNDKGEVSLLEVVKKIKPTVLIGCSTHAGGFTKEVIQAMAQGTERPIILPLSNPSRLVEVNPKDANDWTGGKALLATGSPFPPAKMPNGKEYMWVFIIYPSLSFLTHNPLLKASRSATTRSSTPVSALVRCSASPAPCRTR